MASPGAGGIGVRVKDESAHPTGPRGAIREGTPAIAATVGSVVAMIGDRRTRTAAPTPTVGARNGTWTRPGTRAALTRCARTGRSPVE
ncbi:MULTISPECIES: hypothetical protein [Streptomyces]|uniref:hypothetical protein n=1 Tax=Streptomyces TaxID=1883 RepID=UPI001907DE5C|nr:MULTISPECIES: hypothetical protein [unclassified Streptomyces]MCU4749850.1 hypothetical protein [Streptomyces sp. G-5]QQN76145.1 hypothetical protein IPZ77_00855 [Streptomyces sp. XC 2026]